MSEVLPSGNVCLIPVNVVVFAGGAGWNLQLFGDAQAEHAVFGVGEMEIGLGSEGGEAVDDPLSAVAVKR